MNLLTVLLALALVYFTQRFVSREISFLIQKLGGGKKQFVDFCSALFLPGTLLHEVSHFLMASALNVKTGDVKILPEFIDINEDPTQRIKMGSVQVAKMNPLQGFFVGFAPLITGIIFLVWMASLIGSFYFNKDYILLSVCLYLFFTVANSFFPSKEDLQHTLPFTIIFLTLAVAAWFLGIRFSFSPPAFITDTFKVLTNTLVGSAILNIIILIPLFLINRKKFTIKNRFSIPKK